MITAHVIDTSGLVINSIVLADGADPAAFGAVIGLNEAGIGWSFDGTDWTPPPKPEPRTPSIEELFALVERQVDAMAASRGYDNGVSLASYAASTNSVWAAEAQTFIAWRDQVWEHVYALRTQAQAGRLDSLPTAQDLVDGLPEIAWPKEQTA